MYSAAAVQRTGSAPLRGVFCSPVNPGRTICGPGPAPLNHATAQCRRMIVNVVVSCDQMLTMPTLHNAVAGNAIAWRQHALVRMMERGIARSEVMMCIAHGEIIEQYPKDHPFPSALIAGRAGQRVLHVVAAFDAGSKRCYITTAYEPDLKHFEVDLRTRRTHHED